MTGAVVALTLKYKGLVVLGMLSLLLTIGKAVNYRLRARKGGAISVPSAVIGASVGLLLGRAFPHLPSSPLYGMWLTATDGIQFTLINWVFASLVLGFGAAASRHASLKGTLLAVWHEAIPQVLYAQVLVWGQSCVALGVCALWRLLLDPAVCEFLGGIVPLGFEAGRDFMPSAVDRRVTHAQDYVTLADSCGLIAGLVLGLCLVNLRRTPEVKEWLGPGYRGVSTSLPRGREGHHFHRPKPVRLPQVPLAPPTAAAAVLPQANLPRTRSVGAMPTLRRATTAPAPAPAPTTAAAAAASPLISTHPGHLNDDAGLATHIAFVSLTVFIAVCVKLGLKALERNSEYLRAHYVLSGVRLFKMAMISAMLCGYAARKTRLQFRSEWFHRFSGLGLDFMVVAAVSSIHLPEVDSDEWRRDQPVVLAIMLACIAWQVFAFVVVAPKLFPNWWFERGVTAMGDGMGHSWVGLLLVRSLDPLLQTGVPLAFAYQHLIFFLPSSGSKNTIVLMLIEDVGEWVALWVCFGAVVLWLGVFQLYYRHRWAWAAQRAPLTRPQEDVLGSDEEAGLSLLADAEGGGDDDDDSALRDPSGILCEHHVGHVRRALPAARQVYPWRRLFALDTHGSSLLALYDAARSSGADSFLLLIEDTWGYKYGAYISAPLREGAMYGGNGQTFVFTLEPEASVARWTRANEYFVMASPQFLAVGGGGGVALRLDDDLENGVSQPSPTFANRTLSSSEYFKTASVELWTFAEYSSSLSDLESGSEDDNAV